jgi:hypothetical protein
MGDTATEAKEGTEAQEEKKDFFEAFASEDDFAPPTDEEDEKEGSQDDSSTSSDDTSEGDADGNKDVANETDSEGEGAGASDSDDDDESAAGETIPKGRFGKVVAQRNELREEVSQLKARLAAKDEVQKSQAKPEDEKKEDEDEEDLDEPFMGTRRDFREAVRKEAKAIAEEQTGSVRGEVTKLHMRMSEREFRQSHNDYDKVVYESGFMEKLQNLAKGGDREAQSIVRDILASEDPAAELYDAAREVQGLKPPAVDEIDADNWDQVKPVLDALGLKTTKEKWASRRKGATGDGDADAGGEKKAAKKSKKKSDDDSSGDAGSLRKAPSGAGDTGKSTAPEVIDLDDHFGSTFS